MKFEKDSKRIHQQYFIEKEGSTIRETTKLHFSTFLKVLGYEVENLNQFKAYGQKVVVNRLIL